MNRRAIALILTSAALLSLAACSGSPSSTAVSSAASEPSAAASPDVAGSDAACAGLATVQASVASLKAVDLTAVGTDGLKAALTDVETAVTALAADAKDTAVPERAALSASLDSLKTAVSGLTSDATLREKATELTTAIAAVQTAADGVKAAMPGCVS